MPGVCDLNIPALYDVAERQRASCFLYGDQPESKAMPAAANA